MEKGKSQTQLNNESKPITLSMYKPNALKKGLLDEKIQELYGQQAFWLGAYTNNCEAFRQREDKKTKKFLENNPEASEFDYLQRRKSRLKKHIRQARKNINKHFRRSVAEKFLVPTHQDPKDYFDRQLIQASESMKKVAKTLYPDSSVVQLRNETDLVPISPAQTIEAISSPDTDPALQRELVIRLLHAFASAELDPLVHNLSAERKLAQIQNLFDQKLYEKPIGSTEIVNIDAVYDDHTNTASKIEGIDGRLYTRDIPKGSHIKNYEIIMRKLSDSDIRVFTDPDIKSPEASIVKAVRKAQIAKEKGGKDDIKPSETVQDTHRMMLIVDGGEEEMNFVYNRIKTILEDPSSQKHLADLDDSDEPIQLNDEEYLGQVSSTIEDDTIGDHPSKSKNVKYRRLQVSFNNIKKPIEIKIQDLRHFLYDEFQIGEKDSETGLYDGAAHDLFEFRRCVDVSPYFIAQDLDRSEIDAKTIREETQKNIANRLRGITKKIR